jgi:hypothetical protein
MSLHSVSRLFFLSCSVASCWVAAIASAGCDDGSAVTYTPGTGGGGGSISLDKGVGEPCSADGECRAGLACTDSTCQPSHSTPEGSPCVISAECSDGLYCAGGLCAPAGDGGEGDDCTTDSDCMSGLRCHLDGWSATCVPEGDVDVGGACMESIECFGGLACIDDICEVVPPGFPPFGPPWPGVDCEEETGPVKAYFHIPRGDATDLDFFRLPIPNDVRLDGGQLDLTGFPTPGDGLLGFDLVQRYVDAVQGTRDGWGLYQSVMFRFSGTLDTMSFDGNVKLVNLTDGVEMGLNYAYAVGRTNYVCPNRVVVGSSTGRALEPSKTYAAYFTVGVEADNSPIERPADLVALLGSSMPSDQVVAAHWDKYQPFRDYLTTNTINPDSILNASVFTTGTPRALVEQIQGVIDGGSPPTASSWTLCDGNNTSPCPDTSDNRGCGTPDADFHELHALVDLPIFQQGTAPYLDPADGGDLNSNNGVPEAVRSEQVCLSLTVPKGAPPQGGWPTVVYAHGTGGSFRSHIVQGLAKTLAAGVDDGQANIVRAAMIGIDQVQHGPRRNGSTESPQDLFFNVFNPKAAIGNPQQGAADQMALLRFAPTVSFDINSSPTGEAFSLSTGVGFWGHSQGATHGAVATPYGDWLGVVFSGQGASLKDSLVTKTSPVNIAGVIGLVLQDLNSNGVLAHGARHPVLNLIQQYIDGGDPVAYGRLLAVEPPNGLEARHVFQLYGLDDTYTPGIVQEIYAISAGLDVVANSAVLAPDKIGNRTEVTAPATGNLTVNNKTTSAFLRQYASNNDGHFVAFDVAEAQADALRFLAGSLRSVAPQVGQ